MGVRLATGEVRTRRGSLFGGGAPTPGPGSEVLVPMEDPSLSGAIAQIPASAVTIVVVVVTKL